MKIAIAGYGSEGQLSYRYYADKGYDVTIVTNKVSPDYPIPAGAKAIVQDDAFEQLDDFDLVLRTPPMRPDSIRTGGKVWSATNEFFAKCTATIIGVTGTKGKGTTSSLIAEILRAAGMNVHLVGNIGVPALKMLPTVKPEDVVVYELSSFQLWDLEMSPTTAVVLMIEQDHLDVHRDMLEYKLAKSNICSHQSGSELCIYHPTNRDSAEIAQHAGGEKARFGVPEDGQVYVEDNAFKVAGKEICKTNTMKIAGTFNLDNACAAMSAALTVTDDFAALEKGLSVFTGLPHRLKLVRTVDDVEYYDNSIGTTPGSAIASLRSFPNQHKVLIAGGSDKGADYTELVNACKETDSTVIAIGQTGEKIYSLCESTGVKAVRITGLMPEVVAAAKAEAGIGSVVLLSPASASFDQYKSYKDRGSQFIRAVEEL